MTDRIHRNESTPNARKIWKAVDRGAARAPQKVLDRLAKKQRPPETPRQAAKGKGRPFLDVLLEGVGD